MAGDRQGQARCTPPPVCPHRRRRSTHCGRWRSSAPAEDRGGSAVEPGVEQLAVASQGPCRSCRSGATSPTSISVASAARYRRDRGRSARRPKRPVKAVADATADPQGSRIDRRSWCWQGLGKRRRCARGHEVDRLNRFGRDHPHPARPAVRQRLDPKRLPLALLAGREFSRWTGQARPGDAAAQQGDRAGALPAAACQHQREPGCAAGPAAERARMAGFDLTPAP